MPLLNDIKATLKADIDVTEMNKYLQAYIQEEVKKGVANALVALVDDIVNNKTEEAELRITEKLKGNAFPFQIFKLLSFILMTFNRIGGVMDGVLVSSTVDRRFDLYLLLLR
jgi:hypothetical protein